jgi:hypothetical protein
LPALLRDAGLDLVTLAEQYGIPEDEDVTDVQWLTDIGKLGWVVFMKDGAIRHEPAEQAALTAHKVRCFSLTDRSKPAWVMANHFLNNLPAIVRACRDEGPFIYGVQDKRIERYVLKQRPPGST